MYEMLFYIIKTHLYELSVHSKKVIRGGGGDLAVSEIFALHKHLNEVKC